MGTGPDYLSFLARFLDVNNWTITGPVPVYSPLDTQNAAAVNSEHDKLVQESTELMRISGAILQNSE